MFDPFREAPHHIAPLWCGRQEGMWEISQIAPAAAERRQAAAFGRPPAMANRRWPAGKMSNSFSWLSCY